MDQVTLCDLEVHYHVGVTEAERAHPQRLLVSVEMGLDVARAAATDALADTVDYQAVAQRLLAFGQGRRWALIETVANDIARAVLEGFAVRQVRVEVKKFVIPQARYVSVRVTRHRGAAEGRTE